MRTEENQRNCEIVNLSLLIIVFTAVGLLFASPGSAHVNTPNLFALFCNSDLIVVGVTDSRALADSIPLAHVNVTRVLKGNLQFPSLYYRLDFHPLRYYGPGFERGQNVLLFLKKPPYPDAKLLEVLDIRTAGELPVYWVYLNAVGHMPVVVKNEQQYLLWDGYMFSVNAGAYTHDPGVPGFSDIPHQDFTEDGYELVELDGVITILGQMSDLSVAECSSKSKIH
jgi:hypothetical protein